MIFVTSSKMDHSDHYRRTTFEVTTVQNQTPSTMRTHTGNTSLIGLAIMLLTLGACGGSGEPTTADKYKVPSGGGMEPANSPSKAAMISEADITLGEVDKALVEKGKSTYDVKCQACHSIGENRVVGPGWKGMLTRRKPEWVMNMILNTEAMLSTDAEAQKQLEQCLVRMPNQNLSKDDARNVVEFMRTL